MRSPITPRRLAFVLLALATAPVWAGLDRQLRQQMADGDGRELRVIVTMRPGGRSVRGGSVVERLAAMAQDCQRDLLRSLGGRAARGATVEPLKVCNVVILKGRPETVRKIASRADVATVYADVPIALIHATPSTLQPAPRGRIEWGIDRIGAPSAWRRGVDGRGIVIGSIDTGVDASHPALRSRYRGGSSSWRDYVNGRSTPYDDNGHGTHTLGVAVGGGEGGRAIGVAPGARFIAAKVLDADGEGSMSDLLRAMDFMLDPDGDPSTDDAPDVVNNSWGAQGAAPYFRDAVANWIAAGIVPVFAIGNDGPADQSTSFPGNYSECVGVGATGPDDRLATFSSRGPVRYDGDPYTKPDLCAPGVGILSALPGGRYGRRDGTSMAAPHVTGAIALLKQARPTLRIDEIRRLLRDSAQDLGRAGTDNLFGYGRLAASRAVDAVLGGGQPPLPSPNPAPQPGPTPDLQPYAEAAIRHPRPELVRATLGVVGDPFRPFSLRFEESDCETVRSRNGGLACGSARLRQEIARCASWLDGSHEWYLRLDDRSGQSGELLEFAVVTAGGRRQVRHVPARFGSTHCIEGRVTPAAHASGPGQWPTAELRRRLPTSVAAGQRTWVALSLSTSGRAPSVLEVVEEIPRGWTVLSASPSPLRIDRGNNRVTWRLVAPGAGTRLALEVRAPSRAGTYSFNGIYRATGGASRSTGGSTTVTVTGSTGGSGGGWRLPGDYNGDGRIDPEELLRWLFEKLG